MPGVCSTSSGDELIRWLMPVAPQEGFRSWWESRSGTRKMSIVGVLLPQIIFDTWWFQQDILQQLRMKECFRPLCCKRPLQCKMTTLVWRWWLITNHKYSHCQIPPPPLFVHLSLTENMHHFRKIISLNGRSIKFIKIGNFSVIGVKCDLFSVTDLVGKEVQCFSWCLDLAKASC